MATDLRDKIRKLLALAESPNENEAKTALLMARDLMAKHKLSEAECREAAKQSVKDIDTGVNCSKRLNPWLTDLASVIGEHYCCKAYTSRCYGCQTHRIHFIGLEEDADVCSEIYSFAVGVIMNELKQIRKQLSDAKAAAINKAANSYGNGFTAGLLSLYDEQQQQKDQEWGLVLVTPAEVLDAVKDMNDGERLSKKTWEEIDLGRFDKGYKDGRKFAPDAVLRDPDREHRPRIEQEAR